MKCVKWQTRGLTHRQRCMGIACQGHLQTSWINGKISDGGSACNTARIWELYIWPDLTIWWKRAVCSKCCSYTLARRSTLHWQTHLTCVHVHQILLHIWRCIRCTYLRKTRIVLLEHSALRDTVGPILIGEACLLPLTDSIICVVHVDTHACTCAHNRGMLS